MMIHAKVRSCSMAQRTAGRIRVRVTFSFEYMISPSDMRPKRTGQIYFFYFFDFFYFFYFFYPFTSFNSERAVFFL